MYHVHVGSTTYREGEIIIQGDPCATEKSLCRSRHFDELYKLRGNFDLSRAGFTNLEVYKECERKTIQNIVNQRITVILDEAADLANKNISDGSIHQLYITNICEGVI